MYLLWLGYNQIRVLFCFKIPIATMIRLLASERQRQRNDNDINIYICKNTD